jgi:hypothetical protein
LCRNPRYFGITSVAAGAQHHGEEGPTPTARGGGKFSTPESLSEFCVGCSTEKKPLVLLHLLAHAALADAGLVLIFTSSVDSTHRLCRLLHMCLAAAGSPGGPRAVEEFSSALTQAQRGDLIKRCTQGQVRNRTPARVPSCILQSDACILQSDDPSLPAGFDM